MNNDICINGDCKHKQSKYGTSLCGCCDMACNYGFVPTVEECIKESK